MEFINRQLFFFFFCVLKDTLPATVCDVFFQHSLSQYSKVLQQQEVVKVGRRPVNICCHYSGVMRRVSSEVWVTWLIILYAAGAPDGTQGPGLTEALGPLAEFAPDALGCFFQQLHFPDRHWRGCAVFLPSGLFPRPIRANLCKAVTVGKCMLLRVKFACLLILIHQRTGERERERERKYQGVQHSTVIKVITIKKCTHFIRWCILKDL